MKSDIVLFGTNLSNEVFEYAKAMGVEDLKSLMLRNVEAIFGDEETKEWVRNKINMFHC